MSSAVLTLDSTGWLFVTVALTRYQEELARQGDRLPVAVRDLLALAMDEARNPDRSRQEPTSVDAVAELVDALRVGVLLTTTEGAAKALGVSPRTVERLVASGALPSVSVGGSRRVRVADLHEYVERLGEPDVDAC